MKRWLPIGAAAWLVVAGALALAEEQRNMSPGMATGMENAFPVPFRALQFQNVVRFEESNRGDRIYRVEPEFRWGLLRSGFVSLRAPLAFGSGVSRDSGSLNVQGFYNTSRETAALPATAFVLGTTLPTGHDSAGLDGLIRGILTKSAGWAQVNLNAELNKIGAAQPAEREYRYRFGAGADFGADNLVRTGLFVEQSESKGEVPLWRMQAGLFHHFTPTIAVALGAEVGLSRSAPDYQVILGYQHTFEGFR
ncbi:MAG: hypothetical protein AUI36_14105 [Cyanobacteria bacterium 13_1_40CM_2_61_4]|nr:MAG: hypothetical protein AUI36_14105 [Cyanobacteria bacterium 13_1_40CM_2_61_4]